MSELELQKRSTRATPADRLAKIEARLDEISRLLKTTQKTSELCAAAFAKFATTGAHAVPMKTREVAAVLGIQKDSVHTLVFRKQLKRRWKDGRFHPDDVREYLAIG